MRISGECGAAEAVDEARVVRNAKCLTTTLDFPDSRSHGCGVRNSC